MKRTVERPEGDLALGSVIEVTEPHATRLVEAGDAEWYLPTGKGNAGQWLRHPLEQESPPEVMAPPSNAKAVAVPRRKGLLAALESSVDPKEEENGEG